MSSGCIFSTGESEVKSWEMMREAKDAVGIQALQRIFMVGDKCLYKQMRNPDYQGNSLRPVIKRVRMLLYDLNNVGAESLAQKILNYMAAAVDMHAVHNAQAQPDKATCLDECLDDYPQLVAFHDAIRSHRDILEIEVLAETVKRELDQTVVAYRRELEGEV